MQQKPEEGNGNSVSVTADPKSRSMFIGLLIFTSIYLRLLIYFIEVWSSLQWYICVYWYIALKSIVYMNFEGCKGREGYQYYYIYYTLGAFYLLLFTVKVLSSLEINWPFGLMLIILIIIICSLWIDNKQFLYYLVNLFFNCFQLRQKSFLAHDFNMMFWEDCLLTMFILQDSIK